MAEPRELILKLGQKITDRIGVKVTENDPEYWGLASVVTDEMAEVALAMKVRVPATEMCIRDRYWICISEFSADAKGKCNG